MRMICLISWILVIPMFFVPEPERNATNKQELLANVAAELEEEDNFSHLESPHAEKEDPDSNSKVSKQFLIVFISDGFIHRTVSVGRRAERYKMMLSPNMRMILTSLSWTPRTGELKILSTKSNAR